MNRTAITVSGKNSFCLLVLQAEEVQKPYGIALYDYRATHPDDLAFQVNMNSQIP
jgi:hypothetical protein